MMMKEATHEDAAKLGAKLNLNKELVWNIIGGKRYSNLTEMAMTIQEAFAVPESGSDFAENRLSRRGRGKR